MNAENKKLADHPGRPQLIALARSIPTPQGIGQHCEERLDLAQIRAPLKQAKNAGWPGAEKVVDLGRTLRRVRVADIAQTTTTLRDVLGKELVVWLDEDPHADHGEGAVVVAERIPEPANRPAAEVSRNSPQGGNEDWADVLWTWAQRSLTVRELLESCGIDFFNLKRWLIELDNAGYGGAGWCLDYVNDYPCLFRLLAETHDQMRWAIEEGFAR